MQITVTGKHRPLSDSLKQYIEGKVGELTHYYEKIINANVVLEKESKNHVVSINLRVAGQSFNSENRSTNLRAAIDASVDKLEKQLVKYKQQKWQRKGPRQQEERLPAVETVEPEPVEGEGAIITFEEEDQAEES